jgi:HSP20 family protein
MALERWNPFQDMLSLRDAMDRLMQESFIRPGGLLGFSSQASLPLDVAEGENDFVVHASLPGVKPEDMQIMVQGDMLTIRGETKAEEERKDQQWILHEQRSGTFQRSVRLPVPVNADQVQATFENGVLTLTLPKSEAARARHIRIGTQTGAGALPQTQTTQNVPLPGRTDQIEGRPTIAQQGQPQEPASTQTWQDRVGESSMESFPASDAPSWQSDQL